MDRENDYLTALSPEGDDGLEQELAKGIATTPGLEDHLVLMVDLVGAEQIALGTEISSPDAVAEMLSLGNLILGTPRAIQLVERPEVERLLARHGFNLPRPLGPLPREQVWVVRVGARYVDVEVSHSVQPGASARRRPSR